MVMAGDVLITDSILDDAYVKTTNNYQFSKMFKYVYEYIKDYDLKYYNQETPISGSGLGYSGIICYNTPSNFAIDMMNMGFNMISLATNHVMDGRLVIKDENDYYCDKNEEGIINNINFFKRFDKVYTLGIYDSNEDRDKIVIKKYEVGCKVCGRIGNLKGINGLTICRDCAEEIARRFKEDTY